jgi:hypothetical protein
MQCKPELCSLLDVMQVIALAAPCFAVGAGTKDPDNCVAKTRIWTRSISGL